MAAPDEELAGPAWQPLERVGEGATSVVWKARRGDTVAALKVAKPGHKLVREAEVVGRVGRRWGPAILDVGVLGRGRAERAGGVRASDAELPAGAPYLAMEWTEGEPLDRVKRAVRERAATTAATVATVAFGVARALAELHEAGVLHGDVKPANVVLAPPRVSRTGAEARPPTTAAADRGATLIDLGLAADVAAREMLGGTPRYLPPESRGFERVSPAGDLFALGILLAEVLDARVEGAVDPSAVIARVSRESKGEPWRWVEALVAESPGGRPSAAWIAARAARFLGLARDEADEADERVHGVKRAYVAVRARELRAGATLSDALGGAPRRWAEEALSWAEKLARAGGGVSEVARRASDLAVRAEARPVEPLSLIGRARWTVALVGPVAAAWSLERGGESSSDEAALADRFLALARERPASSWTLDDVLGLGRATTGDGAWRAGEGAERTARLIRELGRPRPNATAVSLAEDAVAAGDAPEALAIDLAAALVRAGEAGRAWAALAGAKSGEADALRAEVLRRLGERARATSAGERALASDDVEARASARATLARLAWDVGDLARAEELLEAARGAGAAEVRALVAYTRGLNEEGIRVVEEALAEAPGGPASARLEATRGMLEHARGGARESLRAFGRAVELATRAAATIEEATYLTGEAAAATGLGDIARALGSATRAALLWERLGRGADAARAWLSRAGALATIGAAHGADEAAEESRTRALEVGDARAAAFARWASVEVRPPGDPRARREAMAADDELAIAGLAALVGGAGGKGAVADDPASVEDRARAAARLLVWAKDAIDDARVESVDRVAATLSAPARWEWWGARAAALLAGRTTPRDHLVLPSLRALVETPAPLHSRGPALDAAARLAIAQGDGEAAQRFDLARRSAARALHEGTPPSLRASLVEVAWARAPLGEPSADVAFAPAQVAQLESIVRALATRDRLKPLLAQVLDTLVLWTGVERGLLLLRAPDDRLVPRAARNLARSDLTGDQLALSQGIARRAMETGETVVATDAFSTLGDLHASVHALRLRSVLAVPLIARGETLGVVYLDDRARKGAFGERELAWVRVVASQAAMAIADAKDQVLLKRAVRRAERAKRRLEVLLSQREVDLDKAEAALELTREPFGSRFRYEAIVGKSEAMRAMLKLVDRVTTSDVPVLLVGESGTGKELVARAMHANGARASRPFVSENCASVPEALLESALFGHVKGAFTGASSTRAGLFDVADGGTLFLDEIGEMPLSMQAKLLRVLQDGEIRPVGGDRTRKVDVRILGATHRDLEAMVAKGTFREDLLYRLNVVVIRVPPLRERVGDIPALVSHLLTKHGGGRDIAVTRAAMERLTTFAWPGNVRQLENEIRRAVVLADDRIDVPELSVDLARGGPAAARGSGTGLRAKVDALEAELLRDALEKTKGNQTRAAELLGLSRFGLQKMMKRLGVGAA